MLVVYSVGNCVICFGFALVVFVSEHAFEVVIHFRLAGVHGLEVSYSFTGLLVGADNLNKNRLFNTVEGSILIVIDQ